MSLNLSKLNLRSVNVEQSVANVFTSGDAVIRICAVAGKTLEIWVDFEGIGKRNKSYSIEKMPEHEAVITAQDNGDYFLISAGEATVRVYKEPVHLVFVSKDDGQVICEGLDMEKRDDKSVFMSHKIKEKEHFYGLGEDNDSFLGSLDRRGQTREMITGQKINVGHVTADIPVTFYMSTGEGLPYGIFTDNSYPMYYDMGKENPDICTQRAVGGDLIFYYFCGENFTEILNEYTNLTGKPPMPPLWTQGYIQCRCSYWNWYQIDELMESLREHRIPFDCIVFDYDWAEYFNNYKWNPRWENKSKEKIASYRKQGIHFMVSNSGPMLKKDSDTYESAIEAGVLARDTEGSTITCGHYGGELIDFSNPKTKEWLAPQLENILDDGVESWWLDLTEPEGDPVNTVYYDGERDKVHNAFSLLNTKTYTEITRNHCPDMRSFILTRTGTAGIQKYGTAIWSGDVYSDYKTFLAHIPEALNTAMSGIPLWTSDAGGFISASSNALDNRNIYKNDIGRHANLYERWVQFACFSPIMRVHHAGESAPYAFGDVLTDSIAHYIRLRYRLLPYIYSYCYKTYLTGEPLIRPLVYEYPDDENVYDLKDEYLFGHELLVAPVTEEEVCRRKVYLPKGTWIDFDYGHVYEGGQSYEIYAPQNRIPVFVRSGSVLPMAQQIYNTSELGKDVLCVEVYPEKQGEFTLYTDDGKSMAYENGDFTLTRISYEESIGECTEIIVSANNDLYAARCMQFNVHVNAVPKDVFVNGVKAGRRGHKSHIKAEGNTWFYDEFSRVLYMNVLMESRTAKIQIHYEVSSFITKPSRTGKEQVIGGQSAFILPPASVPCRIGFENFDRGGEGVAYHKIEPDNEDGIYRSDNVGIETCSDIGCGFSVKNLVEGEWLEYTVNVLKEGNYAFKLRVSGVEGSMINIHVDDKEVISRVDVSGTDWHDVCTESCYLAKKGQRIRFSVAAGEVCGNYFEVI